jgi:hypothetical protein
VRLTLDMVLFDEIPIPDLDDCVDVTTDGKVLYDTGSILKEMTPPRTGTTGATFREIFNCRTAFGSGFLCYTNTVNWVPADNTVLMSYPDENTISQVRRDNGMLVATYGQRAGSYAFSPATSTMKPCSTASPCPFSFEFNHFANISAEGTLMVSSHTPGHDDTYTAAANEHTFQEWTIDRTNRTLVQKWIYSDGPEWPMYKGEAVKLPNGNVLANYGSGGVIREITQDKTTVFYAKFDVPTGDDFYNKFVGHHILIADLYALNGGLPP